jgi:hypothetical protein
MLKGHLKVFSIFFKAKYGQIEYRYERDLFRGLFRWSIDNIHDFWAAIWEFVEINASRPYDQVIDDEKKTGYQGVAEWRSLQGFSIFRV